MARKKESFKEPKALVHYLNTTEYRDYIRLTKGWLESKKYAKGIVIEKFNSDKASGIKIRRGYPRNITLFFVIYSDFIANLRNFKNSKTLNVYLYCGLNADYENGFFQADYSEMGQFFDCTERAIYKWLNELQHMGLIYVLKHNGKHYIFLRPYSGEEYTFADNKPTFYTLSMQYKKWVAENKKEKKFFCVISHNFKKYINTLSGGALKLYIYCSLFTNKSPDHNDYGTFYQSLIQISQGLGSGSKNEDMEKNNNPNIKTISRWFKELKDLHLVEKYQLEIGRASTIYVKPLIPIKNLFKYEWVLNLDEFPYIGHKTNKVIHHKNCEIAKKITKLNRRYFKDLQTAEDKGFKVCKVCNGLEYIF